MAAMVFVELVPGEWVQTLYGALLGGVVMSAVAVLKSSMSLFETCQMSPSEFRTNSAITWTTRFLYIHYIGLIA
jgi:hypothetical protein